MKETWKDIKGYEGLYQVSNYGRIKSVRNNIIRKTTYAGKGYRRVNLVLNGKAKYYYIHRLVAEAFIPNEESKPLVNHKDLNILNNNVDNLEWCTSKENNNYKAHQLKRNISTTIWYMKNNYPNEEELIKMLQEFRKKIEFL